MHRVVCTLDNASSNIDGVDFVELDGVMVAENVPDDIALHFAKIPGFDVEESEQTDILDETDETGAMNYAEFTVPKIKQILKDDPHLYGRVLSDEIAAKGDDARDGVVNACDVAEQSLKGGE